MSKWLLKKKLKKKLPSVFWRRNFALIFILLFMKGKFGRGNFALSCTVLFSLIKFERGILLCVLQSVFFWRYYFGGSRGTKFLLKKSFKKKLPPVF